jgi:glycosyltransferase involved in cell wall biosynthesis
MTMINSFAMPPARSLYVAFDRYPQPKGSSSHIRSMTAALAESHGPLTLLCLGADQLPLHERIGDIEIIRMPSTHSDLLRRATAFAEFVAHHTAARAATLERIVFRDPWGGVPALRTAPKCKAIFEVNALPSWELPYSRPGFLTSAALQAKIADMERFCLRAAKGVLTVSGVTRNALIHEGVDGAKITTIPNAASAEFFDADPADNPIPLLNDGPWCGYIGSLHPWQGVDFLIDAFAHARVDDARLAIIHNGAHSPREMERRVSSAGLNGRVLIHPPLPARELAGAISKMQFTTAPLTETARNTYQGCCPVKVIESMAAGVPVLASDLAVTRELIDHGQNGMLAEPGDLRAWAHAIRAMFGMRISGALSRQRYCWPEIHGKLRKVFVDL